MHDIVIIYLIQWLFSLISLMLNFYFPDFFYFLNIYPIMDESINYE